ncbi:Ribonuclease II, chloroplastic/mitochondrial [Dendrobium catenatum]|uniref:Ribosomal RNA-processing protein 44 n=1 Tax=Dendrobium catenatum TaxID=906689 RepID=A0A2I0WNI1_9ASPA|nr:Ribonuclease II, chloroplastic/mitochondrial [Dendrobium catenatum]
MAFSMDITSSSDITYGLLHGFYHQGIELSMEILLLWKYWPHCQQTEEKSFIVENVNGNVDEAPRNAKACAGSTAAVSSRSFGRVVGIIERNWSRYCESLKPSSLSIENGGTPQAFFISTDCRIPMICIQGGHLQKLLNKRIIVEVDSWDCSSKYPCGHHVETIGEIGEREVENEVILIENDINSTKFSLQALACLPPYPWSLSHEELANPHREDLRHLRVFSVDQHGCKDIDDALRCSLLPNGNFEVGVHIADVTNFVHPGTPLDKEAMQRGTSVYLVDKKIDMLPKILIEGICSLQPCVERFTFSFILTLTPDANIVSTRFTKSTIKSCAALSYVEAQALMDDRHQPAPTKEMLEPLHRMATAVGLDLDISSPKALMDSIDHFVGVDQNCKKQMKILATRCMTKVIYSWSGDMKPTEFHQFGLVAPLYTHFTSPMRRYAEVFATDLSIHFVEVGHEEEKEKEKKIVVKCQHI